jgi:hypothetical protein
MSDLADGSGHMPRRTRVGEGGAPVSGGLAIVLAVVAVVAGFLILRSITNGGENALDPPSSTLSPTGNTAEGTGGSTPGGATGSTVATLPTTSTTPPIVVAGASVVVANANSVGGSATAMSRALETGPGFTMVAPVNSSATVGDIESSVIYFVTDVPAAQQVATSLATVLGGVATIAPMPETPPTSDGSINGAGVLLMLGNDKAGKTLAELAPGAAGGPVVVTNPPVAGQTTSTTTTG